MKEKMCRECFNDYEARANDDGFCSDSCEKDFNEELSYFKQVDEECGKLGTFDYPTLKAWWSVFERAGLINDIDCVIDLSVVKPELLSYLGRAVAAYRPAESEKQEIKEGRVYRNTKTGGLYHVREIALDTEFEHDCVIYSALERVEGQWCERERFVRPLAMFAGKRADGRWYFEKVEQKELNELHFY